MIGQIWVLARELEDGIRACAGPYERDVSDSFALQQFYRVANRIGVDVLDLMPEWSAGVLRRESGDPPQLARARTTTGAGAVRLRVPNMSTTLGRLEVVVLARRPPP